MPPDENQNSNSHTNSLDPTATTQSQPAINYVSSPPAIVLQPKSYKKYLLFFSLAIILIILGVVLLVGHFKPDKVTISSKNTQSTLSTSTSTNIAWDTFNNGHITFKYPANWTVTDGSSSYNLLSLDGINTQQNDGQYVLAVNVDSPSIKPTVALPGDSPQYGKITSLSIGLSISALGTEEDAPSSGLLITDPNSPYRACNYNLNDHEKDTTNTNCNVLSISPLSIDNTSARLFITSDPEFNLQVSDDTSARVGDNNFNEGLFINNVPLEIIAGINFSQYINYPSYLCTGSAGNPCSGPDGDGTSNGTLISLSDIKNFESTLAYSQFIKIINSITIN